MSNLSKRLMTVGCLTIGLVWAIPYIASQAPDELQQVMERAARYVADYEEHQLGNLLVNENYLQNAVYYTGDNRGVIRGSEKRRTEADFLMIADEGDRIGIRQVRTVDGTPVRPKDNLAALLDDTPAAMHQRLAELRQESSSYNIGGVLRKINVPTFALRVARAKEAARFSFEKHGVKKSSDGEIWEVRFKELSPPTLSRGLKDEWLFSNGTLWIEADSGRILKTQFNVKNPYSQPAASGNTEVSYVQDKSLGMLVPSKMTERYETVLSVVTTVANYSKYRKFNVEASSSSVSPRN